MVNVETSIEKLPISKNQIQEINLNLLCKQWFLKQILINGNEDLENYPVNNDEIIFYEDRTYLLKDITFDYEENGTWRISDLNSIILINEDQDDEINLTVHDLTDENLTVVSKQEGNIIMAIYSKNK